MERRSKARSLASLFLVILAISCLATFGCGGGGGGDGVSTIQYTGATTQAVVDDSNADDLTKGAYAGGTSGMMGLGAVSQSGVTDLPRYLNLARTLKDAIIQVDVNAPAGIVESGAIIQESDSFTGDCSTGPASYVININDQTGEFTGSLTFDGYCSEGVTLTGSASFAGNYDDVNGEFLVFTVSITSLTVSSGGDSFTTSGDISFNFQTSPVTVTANLLLRDNTTGEVSWANNYSITTVEGLNYEDINFSGTFYHSDYGFVDVSTTTPFRIYDGDIWPSQGVLEVSGAGGTQARLTADIPFSYRVEVDTDGDGSFDDYDSGWVSW